ncbi:MAG: Uma2 family endonuclease [Prochlorothrix sp.]
MVSTPSRPVALPPPSPVAPRPAPIDPALDPTFGTQLYPDSDGKPMSDNTLQYAWIVRLVSNLRHLFRDQTVFVAGDLLWYPVQVDQPPAPCQAPDVLVALGRPGGYRGSYKQWEEDNQPPQVVFEIISPNNTVREMLAKQSFYSTHGVLEMFFYDPLSFDFWGLVRTTASEPLTPISPLNFPWVSPTLGIRFELFEDGLQVFHPDGQPFEDPVEVMGRQSQLQQERDRAFAKLRELGIDPSAL